MTPERAYVIIIGMSRRQSLVGKFYRTRSSYYRWSRLLFPSAAEVRFMELMGGKLYQAQWIKHPKTKRHLVLVRSLGHILDSEKFGREVRAGRYWIDFANDVYMGLEIDGAKWHRDVVREFERDSYMYQRGWRVIHIPAVKLWNDPGFVQQQVLRFVYD